MKTNTIIVGEALAELKKLPDESIDCVMTSPPYWGLRDYGVEDQLGLEPDFRDFISNLCDIFDEVKRVLKKTGTCWVNLGDTYMPHGGSRGNKTDAGADNLRSDRSTAVALVPEKSLCQIPSRFAIEMTDRGWILRNEIIWYKKNVMPASVKDRFTVDFEKIFFFTKSKKYYFEQQFEPMARLYEEGEDWGGLAKKERLKPVKAGESHAPSLVNAQINPNGRNKRAVWQINPQPFSEAHFAVYPPKLVETPVKAGCPDQVCRKCGKPRIPKLEYVEKPTNTGEQSRKDANLKNKATGQIGKTGGTTAYQPGVSVYPTATKQTGWIECACKAGFEGGIVLDPFFGSGTTGLVAEKLGRQWIGIELNKDYAEIARKRTRQQGLL